MCEKRRRCVKRDVFCTRVVCFCVRVSYVCEMRLGKEMYVFEKRRRCVKRDVFCMRLAKEMYVFEETLIKKM